VPGRYHEVAPARRSPPAAKANAFTSTVVELYLPERPFDATTVARPNLYRVTSGEDPAYGSGVLPVAIDERYWPEEAPYRPAMLESGGDIAEINVIYRVYLTLPFPLKAGDRYTLTVDPAVVAVEPLTFQYDTAPSDAIHVNQVAYVTAGPKTAYVSWWTGQNAISVAATEFQVVDESNGRECYVGRVVQTLSAPSDPWTRSNVYALDFTPLETPGTYHIEVPGVGRSYSFSIGDSAFRGAVGYTVVRGLFMQRDGAGGLDRADLTHFTRPPAHLSDAIEEWTGRRIALAGGHMDAGDRGHYPHNSAAACANLLAPTFYFARQIDALGESLDLPETGNGIPDYVDELTYELDWLASAVTQTSRDGTLGFALRPSNFGYEVGQTPAGARDRVFFNKTYGALRAETLYAAGALAMASNSPVLRKYLPRAKLASYEAAALRAWHGFELHDADEAYWKDGSGWYDPWDPRVQPHMWSDEMVFAAANLLQMTGDPKFVPWIRNELPADLDRLRHWGWVTSSPWLHAFLSLANVTDPQLDPETKQRARAAVLSWAKAEVWKDGAAYDAPFGAPLPSAVKYQVGWFFSNSFASMIAFGLTGDPVYRDRIVRSWNYLLGTNATSRSFFSGLGDSAHRPHWLVHEISDWEVSTTLLGRPGGWEDMAPGLPMADVQMGIYPSFFADAWNKVRVNKQFPAWSKEYPVLYRAVDAWDPRNEFTVATQTAQIASMVPLFSGEVGTTRRDAPIAR
jgi:hypothetical protein